MIDLELIEEMMGELASKRRPTRENETFLLRMSLDQDDDKAFILIDHREDESAYVTAGFTISKGAKNALLQIKKAINCRVRYLKARADEWEGLCQ